MKRTLLLFFLAFSSIVSGSTYYVATTGSDANPGTFTQPWGTWQKAFNTAVAGDTVYFRGGIWYRGANEDPLNFSVTEGTLHDGTKENPICFFGYPPDIANGDSVIWDNSLFIPDEPDYELVETTGGGYVYNGGLTLSWADYIELKNLTIRNVRQKYRYVQSTGLYFYGCTNIKLENVTVYNVGGIGIFYNNWITGDSTYVKNCDVHHAIDSFAVNPYNYNLGQAGSWAQGFFLILSTPGDYMELDGCRSWACADDGYNLTGYGAFRTKNCLSFSNGIYLPYLDYWTEGNGYKLNNNSDTAILNIDPTIITHYVTNSIAAFNKGVGFAENHQWGAPTLNRLMYNNTAYKNQQGFVATQPDMEGWESRDNVYINNIGYANTYADIGEYQGAFFAVNHHNSWNTELGITLTNEDFVMIDDAIGYAQLKAPRKADGSLPDITFLKLASTSDLIDAGTNVGLPYNGLAPDLGYSEYLSGSVVQTAPAFVSAVIENATPSRLEITYNLTLANVVPSTSAFTVTVNSSARTISSVAISGTKVLLTLASPVAYGNVVTVAYTKPATNPLQSSAGGQAASFTAKNVINNCSLTANQPPVITITSPTKSLTFISPATINIEAVASDPDGTIVKVEYYNGSTKLGERTTAPYSFTWKDVLEGTYILTAVAFDNLSATTVSSAVTVVIEKSAEVVNQLPVVTITSPGKSGKYKKHDKIVIVATASDPDGTISKVELKSGNLTVGESTVAPYSFTLEVVDTGRYVLTAIATDNLGATSASSSLELFVELQDDEGSAISRLFPNPNDGHFSIDISSPLPTGENSVSIVNMTGKIIYQRILVEGKRTEEFEMSGSASGTYILLLSTGNTILSSRKFIKR